MRLWLQGPVLRETEFKEASHNLWDNKDSCTLDIRLSGHIASINIDRVFSPIVDRAGTTVHDQVCVCVLVMINYIHIICIIHLQTLLTMSILGVIAGTV